MPQTREQLVDHATRLLHASAAGEVEVVRPLITKNFHFQFMQKGDSWEADGKETSSKLDYENYLAYGVPVSKQITQDGMHFTVDIVVVEYPYVVIFGSSNATSLKGKKYNNNYSWRMRFNEDGVEDFQEYCDVHHAYEVLFEK